MKKQKIIFWSLAFAIISMAIFFRFWRLESAPPGLQYDEAFNVYNATQTIETGDYGIFYPENFGREGLFMNIMSVFIRIFGTSNFGIRFASGVFGSLAVAGFFLLLRELKFSRFATLVGTFMLATSFWHLDFSRTSYRAIMVPFLISWIFFFFLKGINTKKWYWFILGGAFTGLGFHTYISFRVAPLIIIVMALAFLATKKSFFREHWRNAMIFIFSALFVAAPIFIYFYSHWDDLVGRSSAVSVFNAPGMTFPQALGKSLGYHLGAFFFNGDPNQRHNHASLPIIPAVWSILFAVGFIFSLKEILLTVCNLFRRKPATEKFDAALLGQTIFWIMLIPGVLSIEGIPHALRIIGTIPGVFLICTLSMEYIFRMYEKIRASKLAGLKKFRFAVLKVSLIGITAAVIISGLMQTYLYFFIWAKDTRTEGAFEKELFDLGLLVSEIDTKENNYLITAQDIAISQDRKDSSLKTTEMKAYPKIKDYRFYRPLEAIAETECQNSQFVFQKADTWLIDQFKQKCPELEAQSRKAQNTKYEFWILK